ncbi:uncharacterized protein CXorf65 homolog [Lineus longissimus]|uniref:uncharacterized protein CXorf65 homolog n=1 Tax=Lineus longissimus TaxID=88925 RepID=UPI002B4E9FE4
MTVPPDTELLSVDPAPAEETTMFITVRYGENQEKIFNPNCLNKVLLANIKERCGCRCIDIVDLSDEEGQVKNLNSSLTQYGTNFFTNRERLILLKVERHHVVRGEHDTISTTFKPLLQALEEDVEFLDKINPKPSKSRRGYDRDQKSPAENKLDKKRGSQDSAMPTKERRRSSIKNAKALKKFQKIGLAAARSKNV